MKITLIAFVTAAATALILSGGTHAATRMSTIFDKPVSIRVVSLPSDPGYKGLTKAKRSCHYYPNFMVREVDTGQVGADQLAIIPIARGSKQPSCDNQNAGEMVVNPHEWSGYFDGVKGDYVFFDAEDGHNGGMPFAVYSGVTGKKLFTDSRKIADGFRAISLTGEGLELRYRRVYSASCSLFANPKDCWSKVAQATAIMAPVPPDCSKPYQEEMKRSPKFASQTPSLSSVVGYNANVRFVEGKLVITALPGPVECWLED